MRSGRLPKWKGMGKPTLSHALGRRAACLAELWRCVSHQSEVPPDPNSALPTCTGPHQRQATTQVSPCTLRPQLCLSQK